jgi:hypothetical protein
MTNEKNQKSSTPPRPEIDPEELEALSIHEMNAWEIATEIAEILITRKQKKGTHHEKKSQISEYKSSTV